MAESRLALHINLFFFIIFAYLPFVCCVHNTVDPYFQYFLFGFIRKGRRQDRRFETKVWPIHTFNVFDEKLFLRE